MATTYFYQLKPKITVLFFIHVSLKEAVLNFGRFHIYSAIRQGFPLSKMTTNN